MLHLTMMSAKSFVTTSGEEEAILLAVRMIGLAKAVGFSSRCWISRLCWLSLYRKECLQTVDEAYLLALL